MYLVPFRLDDGTGGLLLTATLARLNVSVEQRRAKRRGDVLEPDDVLYFCDGFILLIDNLCTSDNLQRLLIIDHLGVMIDDS